MVDSLLTGANNALSKNVAQLIDKIGSSVFSEAGKQIHNVRQRFQIGFSQYLEETKERCARVKTLIHRYDPVKIEDAYVPVNLQTDRHSVTADGILDFCLEHKHVAISGLAGSGKSMTLKYLYLTACRLNFGFIPIFIELRNLDFSKSKLETHIVDILEPFLGDAIEKAISYGLRNGCYTVFLDGFDEIGHENRARAERQILKFCSDYPSCPVILTSRPDNRLENWSTFTNFNIGPMTIEQVCELISKITFDSQIKEGFIQRVKSNLFVTHRSLLSNPLLTTMMLMTFDEFAEIPSKMHTFYRRAFEVLHAKHDRFKPGFVRVYQSELQFDALERHVSTFAFLSQIDNKISFTKSSLQLYAKKAVDYEGSDSSADAFATDMIGNLCLLVEDGEVCSFIHRSFQEYFAALFLSNRDLQQFAKFVGHHVVRGFRSETVQMLYDMNPEKLERNYIEPNLKKMLADFKRLQTNGKKKLGLVFDSFHINHSDSRVSSAYSLNFDDESETKWSGLSILIGRRDKNISLSACLKDTGSDVKILEYDRSLYANDGQNRSFSSIMFSNLSSTLIKRLGILDALSEYQSRLQNYLTQIDKAKDSRQALLSELIVKNSPSQKSTRPQRKKA